MNQSPLQPLQDTKQAAVTLNVAESTLEKKRLDGSGPKYCKLGKRVLYTPAALQEYIEKNTRRSTSDLGGGNAPAR